MSSEWGNIKECNKYLGAILNICHAGHWNLTTVYCVVSWSVIAVVSGCADSPVSPETCKPSIRSGLKKVPVSLWLLTLLHICGVIPTPQSPISTETQRQYCRKLRTRADIAKPISMPSADVSELSAYIVASNGECLMMFHNVLRVFHDVLQSLTMFYKV